MTARNENTVVNIHPHAAERMKERGATAAEVRTTIIDGETFPAKFGRVGFRCNFDYGSCWNNEFYNVKQVEAIALDEDNKWIVVTVMVKYF